MWNNEPLASVIVLCKNEERNIGSCLGAVFSQRFGGEFEVIVIDSGSADRTLAIARRYPVRLKQIPPEAFHHARTRNFGASLARGRYLVFLGADAKPAHDGWLAALLEGIDAPDVAGCYGRQLPRSWAYPMERFFLAQLYPATPRVQRLMSRRIDMETTWFSNVNSALRRDVWERIPFPDDAVMTEDQIWSRRALEAGYTILYHPTAAVYHSHNYSLVKAFRRYFDSGMTSGASYLPAEAGSLRRLGQRGVSYLTEELDYLVRGRHLRWVPYALAYELAKFSGITAGRQHRALPPRLVRGLSHNTRAAER